MESTSQGVRGGRRGHRLLEGPLLAELGPGSDPGRRREGASDILMCSTRTGERFLLVSVTHLRLLESQQF